MTSAANDPQPRAGHGADLSGRVAIVTGAGRGLGRAMALGLARAGARVLVTAARESAEIEAVAAAARDAFGDGRAIAHLADVSDPAACARAVETAIAQLGGVDILVNNAGRGMKYISEDFLAAPTRFWEADPDAWRLIIDTNVNGPFHMARAVVPAMLDRGWGRIVNISMNHDTMRRAGFSPYGPSKAALESETVIWARDLSDSGVTVNALLPGAITDSGMIPDSVDAAARRAFLDPEVMVAPLLWIVSADADGATGGRYVANRWDPALAPDAAAAGAREAAGWAV